MEKLKREIKFRAWARIGEWDEDGEKQAFGMIDADSLAFEEFEPLCDLLKDKEDEIYFMQFTGLHDKSGKEIYEGDILEMIILGSREEYIQVNKDIKGALKTVEYKNGCWGFSPNYPEHIHIDDRGWKAFWQGQDEEMWDMKYFKIIGNIYENPSLLEETSKG